MATEYTWYKCDFCGEKVSEFHLENTGNSFLTCSVCCEGNLEVFYLNEEENNDALSNPAVVG